MPKCRSCDFPNLLGTDRCVNCGAEISPTDPGDQANLESRLRSLLDQGRKIEAIKLKDAKDAVEAIAEKHNIPKGSGAGVIVFVLVVGGCLLLW